MIMRMIVMIVPSGWHNKNMVCLYLYYTFYTQPPHEGQTSRSARTARAADPTLPRLIRGSGVRSVWDAGDPDRA
jgi:hypothetical protein